MPDTARLNLNDGEIGVMRAGPAAINPIWLGGRLNVGLGKLKCKAVHALCPSVSRGCASDLAVRLVACPLQRSFRPSYLAELESAGT